MERRKHDDGRIVMPVFYHVDPSHVRNQRGSFAEAFSRHEERFKEEMNKVEEWRRALKYAADLAGMALKDRYESEFIQEIVKQIGNKLDPKVLNVAPYAVGIDYRVQGINMWLNDGSNDVGVAVIYGMGGIGKTTIAKAAYNLNLEDFKVAASLQISEKLQNSPVVLFACKGNFFRISKRGNWHAFGQPQPIEGYIELSRPAVEHCGGIPLALQVLGSSLSGKEVDEKDFTITILDNLNFYTRIGIQNLVDRCLVKINNEDNRLNMHHLLRDMGRGIIREESPQDPGRRSRLWHKDAFNILRKMTGTEIIKGLMLNLPKLMEDESCKTLFNRSNKKRSHVEDYDGNFSRRRRLDFFSWKSIASNFSSTNSAPASNEVDFKTEAFKRMNNLELLLLYNPATCLEGTHVSSKSENPQSQPFT
ncbi:hypothetical protein L3X38_012373 [Prunus dulcis]|uniref:TIR domain-containing protein n=1 Tax=Prunus dulcis TaxID=3755 RepID=A0AAD4ZGB4_PRUDU|nr:hypothetical protein L3X38_012373 [Prunus dulcis]